MALTKIKAAGLTADLIDETKLADNSIDSEHYNDGSIDNAHLSDDAVDSDELAAGAVDIAHLSATGTAGNTTYLRGDNTWTVPPDINTQLSTEEVQDIVGAMFTGNTETNITATYEDSDGTIDLVVSTSSIGGATGVDFNDNVKARWGTGNDLEIYHDGSNSYLKNTTGDFRIDASGPLMLRSDDVRIYNAAGSEFIFHGKGNGSTDLYYDNSKQFETTSYGSASAGQLRVTSSNATTVGFSCGDAGTGLYNSGSNAIGYSANGTQKWNINSSGDLRLVDSVKAAFGTGDDLQIYHSGSHSFIENSTGELTLRTNNAFAFQAKDDNEYLIYAVPDAEVRLYYDGTKRFETYASGTLTTGNCKATGDFRIENDTGKIELGASGDLQVYHDGTSNYIKDATSKGINIHTDEFLIANAAGNENILYAVEDGAVNLYYDNAKKLETASYGIGVYGYTQIGLGGSTWGILGNDSVKIGLGNDQDLQLYHDGSHSRIVDAGTGDLKIQTNSLQLLNAAGDEYHISAVENAATKLYYDNSTKLETTSYGTKVTGNLLSTGSVVQTASNIYQGNRTTTTSNAYIEAGVGYVDITPKSTSSKVLIRVTGTAFTQSGSSTMGIIIRRHLASDNSVLGTSPIGNGGHGNINTPDGATIGMYQGDDSSSNIFQMPFTIEWLDSPSSTSTLRYRIHIASNSTAAVGIGGRGDTEGDNTVTTMIAMEIGG